MSLTSEISPLQAWLMAIRPKTLPAAVSPVLVGIALAVADGVFAPLPAIAALVGSLLIQIGTNLANDYFDYVKGTDVAGRKGPTRVAQGGLISLSHLRLGIAVTFTLAALVGLYLVLVGGWPILAIGVASLISALAYTGGPFPFGYHGLWDLFVFLFFGLAAVCGTYYVQALTLTPAAIVVAVPIGALTVAILVVNNLRDIETDCRTGKRTLAVMIGPRSTRLEYVSLLVVAYAVPLISWMVGWAPAWVLLPWLTVPLALHLIRTLYRTTEGQPLNRALAGTANLDLAFSLLFALGLVL
ncbi:MAG: 1,4-dihydroxy-2-naphthoate polyprenyltransferase [Anaerolineae bacterium]